MKPESQRRAIAEACGWLRNHPTVFGSWIDPRDGRHYELPDYLNDLNAMHEAAKTLLPSEKQGYLYVLWEVTRASEFADIAEDADLRFAVVHATAAERAKAFLIAKGLWKEGE